MDLHSAFQSEGGMVKQSWLKGICSDLLYSPTLNANAAPSGIILLQSGFENFWERPREFTGVLL